MHDLLLEVQRKQFTDQRAAETLLLDFVRRDLHLDAVKVELRPLAVSLNSFNGVLTFSDGRRRFFKTHTESDSVVSEYYNSEVLAEVGYPILRPLHSSVEAGRQFLVYEVVEDPSVFDVAHQIEDGKTDVHRELLAAQEAADQHLFKIYQATLNWQSGEQAAASPIHQLFFHRLNGRRMREGYAADVAVVLPGMERRMGDLRRLPWTVNGQRYEECLDDLIAEGLRLLHPAQEGPSIVGHGDAHNGNIFFRRDRGGLTYFDPAFGGRHDPLLDVVKPVFHNTFAMWMYIPDRVARGISIQVAIDRDRIHVQHDYRLHPIRRDFIRSKMRHTVGPVIRELQSRGWLHDHWRRRLKVALFCCPLLTKVLTDRSAFPPEITLLGLCYAMEMGAESAGTRSLIDRSLDQISGVDGRSSPPAASPPAASPSAVSARFR